MIQSLRNIKRKFEIARKVNWVKTLYFNFKMFAFPIAKKIPVFFYGSVKFTSLKGEIKIIAPIKSGMIGFGQPYEMTTRSRGIAELFLEGRIIINGHIQFGKDCFVYVKKDAQLQMGHMASLASLGKIICTNSITLGTWARIGSESQLIDTNFHQMIDTKNDEKIHTTNTIAIGNYNFISNRVSIMSNTLTPDFCTIASNSLTNKNYVSLGQNTLIGGLPAKLLKENISRDWVGEKKSLEKNLIINF